jgi:cytochrome bd-type quinol oxidase subunit 2
MARLVAGCTEQHTDPEIKTVQDHIEENCASLNGGFHGAYLPAWSPAPVAVSVSCLARATPMTGLPFAMTSLFFAAAFLSLAVMFWPYIIPYALTVRSAAAPEASLRFLFYGAIVILPVIFFYTIGVYWAFRGKVGERYD